MNSQSKVQILFNLDTLNIIEINRIEENVTKNGIKYSRYYNKQEIPEQCKRKISNFVIIK